MLTDVLVAATGLPVHMFWLHCDIEMIAACICHCMCSVCIFSSVFCMCVLFQMYNCVGCTILVCVHICVCA